MNGIINSWETPAEVDQARTALDRPHLMTPLKFFPMIVSDENLVHVLPRFAVLLKADMAACAQNMNQI